MRGRLNSFQKTMLQWNDMHPYSAVHVVQIPGPLEEARLQHAIQCTLQTLGLTNLNLDREKFRYRFEGGTTQPEIKILPDNRDPLPALLAETEKQLNVAFDQTSPFNPFRFFVTRTSSSFFLGLTYFHAAADAESIVLLLKDLSNAYLGKIAPEQSTPLDLYPDGASHLLRRHTRVVVERLRALPSQVRAIRQSHRPRYRDPKEMSNGFTFFSIGKEGFEVLAAARKSWGITINDLLLALLMQSLSPLASGRAKERKRRKISIGCIVNLRRDLQIDNRGIFGLFLGSFTVTHEVPDGIRLSDLAKEIGHQTLAIKGKKLYLGTSLELGFARFMLRFFSREQQKKFYLKNYPLWGGITNMNLNSLLGRLGDDAPMNYFRGVSTGPATPLVLSVTTVRDLLNIGLSYRSTVFSKEAIEDLKCRFIGHLEQLKEFV
jgi:NRPS condensation-like uncharacterized protein